MINWFVDISVLFYVFAQYVCLYEASARDLDVVSIMLRDISLFLPSYESSAVKGANVALTSDFYFIVLDDQWRNSSVGVALFTQFYNETYKISSS